MLEIVGKGFMTALAVLLPILGATMVIGVIISILQAATQIQEMTLTFIPKLFITLLMILIAGPWIMRVLMNYARAVLEAIPTIIK